jgi:prophage tail gpP-like protein
MLTLKINDRFRNRKIDYFNRFELNLKHDSIGSTFGFQFYFDPENPEHKELACVTHFHEVTLEYNTEMVVKGVLTSQNFSITESSDLCSFGGYSLPGVLEDCEIPTSLYPLQSDGLSIAQIARKLCAPFKIEIEIDPTVSERMNSAIDTSTASDSSTIKQYLSGLCAQRKIIMSHTPDGKLFFTESKTETEPILRFDFPGRSIPGYKFLLEYNGQGMHSHITLQKQASIDGGNAGETTIRNPYVIGSVFRPTVKRQSSGTDNDTQLAARQELSNELRDLRLTIEMDRWDVDGKVIRPNQIISIKAPKLFLFKETKWFIESVTVRGDERSNTATLTCVLPEVYNDKPVESIFSGINIHPAS